MTKEEALARADELLMRVDNMLLYTDLDEWLPENCEMYPVEILLPKSVVAAMQKTLRESLKNAHLMELAKKLFAHGFADTLRIGVEVKALQRLIKMRKEDHVTD